ncbi:hypothetical protein Tco_0977710 [Tanacetum coccineum]|uniref:Uncharacterized protein n=1 Tax=Tanacetum coccineum TaxID=301880 RepID=A0ABQ5EKV3_9ASTR
MSADSAVTYTSVHSEARSWSIPSEDPYEEAAQQLFEQAPRSPGAPIPLLPPSFLAPRIRPLSPRALEVEMRDVASAYYHSVHPSGTPQLLPIPLPAPSSSRELMFRVLLHRSEETIHTTPRPGLSVLRISYQVDVCIERSSVSFAHDTLTIAKRIAAGCEKLTLEARITLLETEARQPRRGSVRLQMILAVQHICCTQALEAGARIDTLEDTGSSS